jgi:hypothetical protein
MSLIWGSSAELQGQRRFSLDAGASSIHPARLMPWQLPRADGMREMTHRNGIMINDTERASVHHVSRQPASGAAGPRLYLLDREAWIIPR